MILHPAAFAGLWDEWADIETGEPVKSRTIIVTDANALARRVYDRMPVILDPGWIPRWVSGAPWSELLRAAADGLLRTWPVSRRVNWVGNENDPTVIRAVQ